MMRLYVRNMFTEVSPIVFALLICFSIAVPAAKADTLYVPLEYSTIQAAINAASVGDEVIVADGTYIGEGNKDLDFVGKAITVRSENGPENCIIDCQGSGRGFYFHSGENGNSIVQGFTIQNGYVDGDWPQDSGGSISCISSSPAIIGNVISGNFAIYGGGGVFCFDFSSPLIQGNTITGNSAYLGAGIYCFESSSPLIQDNIMTGNSASPGLAGGGAISCSTSSSPTIMSNTIVDNSAAVGGGIDIYHYASPTVINNVIVSNSASVSGGGICCFDVSSATIINNTIINNVARRYGSGIFCGHFSDATVVNTILWNVENEVDVSDSSITVTYSNVQGGYAGEGNIDAVPSFVSLRKGDYRLRPKSPCIGAGTNIGAPESDRDGNSRPNPFGSNCDIGAYESRLGQPIGAERAPGASKKSASTWGNVKQ